jgi:hypothetical protein
MTTQRARRQRHPTGKLRLRMLVPIVAALVVRAAAAHGSFTVDRVVEDLTLPVDTAERIRSGGMVHSVPTESSEREMAVGLTFLVQHPLAGVLKAFLAAVDLKADPQLSASVPIRGPGTLADFASLVLEPDGVAEAKRYLGAHAGDTLNLSAEEIQAFNALVTNDRDPKPRVEAQLKRLLLGRYQAYLANGLDGIAPYARGSGPREPSEELRRATQASNSSRSTRPHSGKCYSPIRQKSPRGSKSTSTGCAMTSTVVRTTHCATVWPSPWEKSLRSRIASFT